MLSWEVSWDFGPCSKISYLLCLAWPCFINHSLRALPLYQSRWKYLQHLRASETRSNDEHKSTEFILFLFCILLMSILLLKDQSSDTRLYLINFKSWNITSCSVPSKSDAKRHLPSKQNAIFPCVCWCHQWVSVVRALVWISWTLYNLTICFPQGPTSKSYSCQHPNMLQMHLPNNRY